MLAKLITLFIVAVAMLGPAVVLLRTAWFQGGWARNIAVALLCVAFILTSWLMAPTEPGQTREDHISQFVGAWGILVAIGGTVAVVAYLLGALRDPPPDEEP